MNFNQEISVAFVKAIMQVYNIGIKEDEVIISLTKKEFDGDYTILLFPFTKQTKESPENIGEKIGLVLGENVAIIKSYNVIKGFLNLEMTDEFWLSQLTEIAATSNYGHKPANGKKVMVEFSSPNTNKPLHLGHIRNILLGWSTSNILKANGYEVIKTQIINDRGIAICKSMLAWLKFSNEETPASSKTKSDHFVGKYYVEFETRFQEEYKAWQATDEADVILKSKNLPTEAIGDFFKTYKNTYFNEYSILGKEAREMLQKWENGDADTLSLWSKMNQWVYDGFAVTYDKLKVNFDKNYYESSTYLLGKDAVSEGLERKVFEQDADSSVWVDLTDIGMDRKIVLRSDGTAVYMTQDLGTAMTRYKDFGVSKMIYTVADEQDYHFKVLFEILKRLKEPYADGLHHLSYGMVDLTTGKMKSREGTVVDADDLIMDVVSEATKNSKERGELLELSREEQNTIFNQIGLGALKFFILKVQPKKRMTFDPQESLDMQGQTGPYIQNAYVRIQSLFRKNNEAINTTFIQIKEVHEAEKTLMKHLLAYPEIVEEAGKTYEPSSIANFSYALAKDYHRFYHDLRILGAATEEERNFRLLLSENVGKILNQSMQLLGIEMPSKM
jgi:arginyl-tRNA synthetase